jgi:hypothetical protein
MSELLNKLNDEVHEKVFGTKVYRGAGIYSVVPDYAQDITRAFQIVERLEDEHELLVDIQRECAESGDPMWWAEFHEAGIPAKRSYDAIGYAYLPECICRAALKALEAAK